MQLEWSKFCENADEEAFATLFEASKRLVWTLCWRLLGNEDDAADAFQGTYARVIARAREAGAAHEEWSALVYRSAVREADAARRRRANRSRRELAMDPLPPIASPAAGPAIHASDRERRTKLETLLSLLPDDLRLALQLHYLHGLTLEQIGQMQGRDKSTISRRIEKGLKRLRPLAERAGLGEWSTTLTIAAAGAAMLDPPAAIAAQAIWSGAGTAAVAGGFIGNAGLQTILGGMAMKGKAALGGLAIMLLAGGIWGGLEWLKKSNSNAPNAGAERQTAIVSPDDAANVHETVATSFSKGAGATVSGTTRTETAATGVSVTNDSGLIGAPMQQLSAIVIRAGTGREPVEGARIFVTPAEGPVSAVVFESKTTASGSAIVRFPQAWGRIRVSASESMMLTQSRELDTPTSEPVVFVAAGAGAVFGTVKHANGDPAAGATVVADYPGSASDFRIQAASDGTFEMGGLPAGAAQFIATLDPLRSDMDPQSRSAVFVVAGRREGPVALVLQAGASIAGFVRDVESGLPIAGASVRLDGGRQTATDAAGRYAFEHVPMGRYSLLAGAAGFAGAQARVNANGLEEFRCDLALDPAIDVIAQVQDGDENPIDAALLIAHAVPVMRTTTDASGEARVTGISRLQLPHLSAHKEGYKTDRRPEMDTSRESEGLWKARFKLVKVQDYEKLIVGRVTDPVGKPLEGVKITWKPYEGSARGERAAATDARGDYRLAFQSQEPEVILLASKEGWAPDVRTHVLSGTPQLPARVDFMLEAGSWLAGRVKDEFDYPIAGATVTVMPSALDERFSSPDPSGVERSAQSDSEGRFRIEGIGGPTVAVEAGKGDPTRGGEWVPARLRGVGVDREVEITLKGVGRLSGRVIERGTGNPVSAFRFRLIDGTTYDGTLRDPGASFSHEEGRFTIEDLGRDEPLHFKLTAEGFVDSDLPGIPARGRFETDELTIEMTRGDAFKGILVDAATGAPVAGARVWLGWPKNNRVEWLELLANNIDPWFDNLQASVSAADGSFEFRDENERPGTLMIAAEGFRRTTIRPAERAGLHTVGGRLMVPLEPGVTLRGRYVEGYGGHATGSLELMGGAGADAPVLETFEIGTVGPDGRFTVEGLKPGSYRIFWSVRDPHNEQVCKGLVFQAFELRADGPEEVLFGNDLGPLIVRGQVTLDSGEVPPACRLELRPQFPWDHVLFRGTVHRVFAGRFYLRGLKPGRYAVRLLAEDGRLIQAYPDLDLQQSEELSWITAWGAN